MESSNDALSRIVGLAAHLDEPSNGNSEESSRTGNSEVGAALNEDAAAGEHEVNFEEEAGGPDLAISQSQYRAQRNVQKELEKLKYYNPGDQTKMVLDGKRTRRKAAINASAASKSELYHDKHGRLVVESKPVVLCDCLRKECPGCHWPCADCGKRLCGPICQMNRKFIVTSVREPRGKDGEIRTDNPFLHLMNNPPKK